MITQLTNTTSREIMSTLLNERRALGPASGMVFTLIVVTPPQHLVTAFSAALEAGRAHPSRIIVLSVSDSDESGVDADLHFGESIPGDLMVLRFKGDLVAHADSVVLPLLLPDSPTVVWWPYKAPADLSKDPIGSLATRRVTDAATAPDPVAELHRRANSHVPGNTDLTWTRLTPWRALLAAALDQYRCAPTGVEIESEADSATAALLASWLQLRLGVPVSIQTSEGPSITAVRLKTQSGDVAIVREDGFMASYIVPEQVNRSVALKRRGVTQLITEELQRMDPDEVFDEVLANLAKES